jgi:transglutaminase-like putative cysteine protease
MTARSSVTAVRRLIRVIGVALVVTSTSFGGENPTMEAYRASTIDRTLVAEAHAAVRFERQTLVVTSVRAATLRMRRIVTILDAEGRDFGEIVLPYNRFARVDDIEGKLYDADGVELRSLDGEEVKDYAATQGQNLYDDNRVRFARLVHGSYPYTVEYSYTYTYDGYISWPTWYPQEENASVEYSALELRAPKDLKYRVLTNGMFLPAVSTSGDQTVNVWEGSSFAPFTPEPFGPDHADQRLSVRLSPDQFEIDGHPGELTSWKAYGSWYHSLQANRQALPPGVGQAVAAAMSNAATRRDTVRALYDYLQSKTRYVSVQLGIGGWQPFDASFVAERGYGDCKALTNYMLSLLRAVRIPAFPVLIKHGVPRSGLAESYPCNMFNHVILCVPDGADSLWLECTSQTIPFGHIGAGNENRLALMVTPAGGVVVRTPRSKAEDNLLLRTGTVEMLVGGGGRATLRTSFAGDQQDYAREALIGVSPQDREDWVRSHVGIPSYEITGADYSQSNAEPGTVEFSLELALPRYATQAGSRLIFQPNLAGRRLSVPPSMVKRTQPIYLQYPYLDVDSIDYVLPPGYVVEALPKPVEIQTPFARYACSITPVGTTGIRYARRLEVTSDELPAESYEAFRAFFQGVAQSDKANVSVIRR